MRVMVFVKASQETENGVLPSTDDLTAMGKFNEDLVKAGVMVDGGGLHPSSKGKRVIFKGNERIAINGPFRNPIDLIAGYWIWQVKSMDEAVAWVKRCPNPTGTESQIEIRPIMESEDLGSAMTPELKELEEKLRAQSTEEKKSWDKK